MLRWEISTCRTALLLLIYLQVLAKHVLKILAGSEGKLAQPEQRIAVLLGIAAVSSATLSASHKESLASIVITQMSPFILQEGHEGALLQALSTAKTWCKYVFILIKHWEGKFL